MFNASQIAYKYQYPNGPKGAVLNPKLVADIQAAVSKIEEDLKTPGTTVEDAIKNYVKDERLQELLITAIPSQPKVVSQRVYEKLSQKEKTKLD